jgi:hypothetical protein
MPRLLLFPITAVATATLLLGSAIQGFAQEKSESAARSIKTPTARRQVRQRASW